MISIICGYSPDREYLYARTLAEMQVELMGLPVEYVVERMEGEWNECVCKNAGAKQSHGEVLIFTNCDIVIRRVLIDTIAVNYPLWGGHWILQCKRLDEQPDGTWVENEHALGDFQCVPRGTFDASGGFDERMTGWGYLDYDFAERCKRVGAKEYFMPHRVKHYWHPRLTDDEYRAMNQKNRQIACQQ